MKMNFHLISLITLFSLLNITSLNAISSKDKPLIEAGCKKKKWDENGEYLDKDENKTFDWVASGKLLEKGACLEDGYRYWVVPEKGLTIAYTTPIVLLPLLIFSSNNVETRSNPAAE